MTHQGRSIRLFLVDGIPSAAAAVISGRAANGRTAWREINTQMTYGEWQSLQIDQQSSADISMEQDQAVT